jgi:hypothetical protein
MPRRGQSSDRAFPRPRPATRLSCLACRTRCPCIVSDDTVKSRDDGKRALGGTSRPADRTVETFTYRHPLRFHRSRRGAAPGIKAELTGAAAKHFRERWIADDLRAMARWGASAHGRTQPVRERPMTHKLP